MITILENYKWLSSPTAYITIKYEYVRSGTSLIYRLYWKVWLGSATSYFNDRLTLTFVADKVATKNCVVKEYGTDKGWSKEGYVDGLTVPNKTNGTPTSLNIKLVDTNTGATKLEFNSTMEAPAMPSQIRNNGTFDVDGAIVVAIDKYDANTSDTLTIALGGTTVKTVANIKNGASITFTDAEKAVIYKAMTAVTSASFIFAVSSTLGTTSATRQGYIANAAPNIDVNAISYKDTASAVVAVTGNNKILVQKKSQLSLNIPTAIGQKGATIVKYAVKIGNDKYETATSGDGKNFGLISGSGNLDIVIVVTDSRGNTVTASKAINVLAYSEPTILATAKRKNNYEAETTFRVDASFASVGGFNAVEIKYQYAKVGEAFSNNTTIENGASYILTCDQRYAYSFRVTVTDRFGASVYKVLNLTKGELPLFIDIEKNAVGINAFPLVNEALRVGNGVAVFEDGIVLQSSTEGSTKLFKITVNDSGNLTATEYK